MFQNREIGYYTCDGLDFSSKIEACIYAQTHNKTPQWVFNDDVFGKYDWTVEPEESLKELYDRRAKELREKYDYIAISYSGGSDSHNLLQSFIRQNLHVDEILVNTFEKANTTIINNISATENWNYGAEYKLQIYPRLQELNLSKTKITVTDMSDYVFDIFKGDASWVLDQKEVINPSGISRYNYLHFKEVHKRFDVNKRIALVLGVEKPSIIIRNGQLHLVFFDKSANITPAHIHFKDQDNTTIEYFYWHPSCTRLIAKQVHTIKHWILAHPSYRPLWDVKDRHQLAKNGVVIHKLLRGIIYSDTWNHDWFQTDKSTKFWMDEIDAWWHSLYKNTNEYKVWLAGVDYIKTHAGRFIDSNGDSLVPFYKKYFVSNI